MATFGLDRRRAQARAALERRGCLLDDAKEHFDVECTNCRLPVGAITNLDVMRRQYHRSHDPSDLACFGSVFVTLGVTPQMPLSCTKLQNMEKMYES